MPAAVQEAWVGRRRVTEIPCSGHRRRCTGLNVDGLALCKALVGFYGTAAGVKTYGIQNGAAESLK